MSHCPDGLAEILHIHFRPDIQVIAAWVEIRIREPAGAHQNPVVSVGLSEERTLVAHYLAFIHRHERGHRVFRMECQCHVISVEHPVVADDSVLLRRMQARPDQALVGAVRIGGLQECRGQYAPSSEPVDVERA